MMEFWVRVSLGKRKIEAASQMQLVRALGVCMEVIESAALTFTSGIWAQTWGNSCTLL